MSQSSASTAVLDEFVSVDDHVVEPGTVWTNRLPSKYRDSGPRIVRERIGDVVIRDGKVATATFGAGDQYADWWCYEDLRRPLERLQASVSFGFDHIIPGPTTYDEILPGTYDPSARLLDMDKNAMQASLCFPTFPRFCGQTFLEAQDKELALLCVRAYNDWMVEEWCAPSSGRLWPLCLVPLWDPVLAADEIRRNAQRGVRAVTFPEGPAKLGLPSIHTGDWAPFFTACDETHTVICTHIGSSSSMPITSVDAPPMVMATLSVSNSMGALLDFLFSGVFERYPRVKLSLAEGQIGWLPYVLERADKTWLKNRQWADTQLTRRPSEYFRDHVFACFFDDTHGVEAIDRIGEDNVMFEVDYPHNDSSWPHSQRVIDEWSHLVSPEVKDKLLRSNARRLFGYLGN